MNPSLRLPILLLVTSLNNFAHSEEQCNPEGSQAEIGTCIADDYKSADAELNQVYKKLMSSLSPDDQAELRKEQRAWIKKRDSTCAKKVNDLYGEFEGYLRSWELTDCLGEMTDVRIQQISHWKINEESSRSHD